MAARETVIAEEVHDLPTETNDAFRGRPEFKAELALEHEGEVIVGPAVLLGKTTHVQESVGQLGIKEVLELIEGWLVVLQDLFDQGSCAPCRGGFEALTAGLEQTLCDEIVTCTGIRRSSSN